MPPSQLWQCPRCGAKLVTANGRHSCGTFDLEPLFARSSHVHVFRLRGAGEIDAAFRKHLRAAYAVGQQAHLTTRR